MHEQSRLARRRRALERCRGDPDDDPSSRKGGEDVSQREGTFGRVELVSHLEQSGGRRGVEVRAEREDEHVRFEGARIRLDPLRLRIDGADDALDEPDSGLLDVPVGMEHLVGLTTAEHDVELGEPKDEPLSLVDEGHVDVGSQPFRESGGKLQAAEAGT